MDIKLRFKVNRPQVVHETFEDEAVIINLETGNYFSFDNTARMIWDLIGNGASGDEIAASLAEYYRGNKQEIENAVAAFIAELEKEKLIAPLEGEAGFEATRANLQVKPDAQKVDFKAPVIQKYTDMQELLLLDPIHDVDEKGWPAVKPDQSNA